MQKFFKNQKTLAGVIGLAILGAGNAQAISLFNKQEGLRPGNSNILSGLEVLDSLAVKRHVKYVGNGGMAISDYPSALPAKAVARFAAKGASLDVLDSWFIDDSRNDLPLSSRTYLNGDVFDVVADDGAAFVRVDSLETLISFHFDAGASRMVSAKAPTDENIKASPVPLPAAAWSFLIGLMGILGLKKRKNPPPETN